ncbi:MAG: hypothetical protein EBR83_05135 [Verrucomicrobia bacterium]|jgi:predicted lipid-binding transport protein (Tim44 family)|nr:hypothetical protein [Verrucomicrobiota bacterium]
MDSALLIKACLALVAFVIWVIGKAASASSGPAPLAATPPPVARRTRRVRNAPAPASAPAAPVAPAPAAAAHLDASSLVVTRPARAHTRTQFRGSAALRQAIVAREVLGLPLALRPPRF